MLFLTDVFGIDLVNSQARPSCSFQIASVHTLSHTPQLLADDYARNGFKVVAPDYLNGDSIAADALQPGVRLPPPIATPHSLNPSLDVHTEKLRYLQLDREPQCRGNAPAA